MAAQEASCSGACMKDFGVGLISETPMVREAILVNIRLGIFWRILQIIALGGVIWFIVSFSAKEADLSNVEVSYGALPANVSSSDALHCTAAASFTYSAGVRQFRPTRCRPLGGGEDVDKDATSMYFMTFVNDTIVQSEPKAPSCQNVTKLKCEQAGGVYKGKTSSCTCTFNEGFFVQNQESSTFFFRHSYEVDFTPTESYAGSSFQEGYMWKSGDKSERRRGNMLTRIKKKDGSICSIGGRDEWLHSDALDGEILGVIGGSITEWLACADYTLDSDAEGMEQGGQAPKFRVSGTKIVLQLKYTNQDKRVNPDIQAVCDVTVDVRPSWTSRTGLDTAWDAGTKVRTQRFRSSSGVSFSFESSGTFYRTDSLSVINAIVKSIVILGLPLKIVLLVALYGIGVVSQIYQSVLRQRFNIVEQFHGLSARMMVNAISYRLLTSELRKHMGTTVEETHIRDALSQQSAKEVHTLDCMGLTEIEERMLEAFKKEKEIEPEEVKLLAHVVVAGLDKEKDLTITFDEFVHACSGNEYMDTKTMIKFFDDERKLYPVERLLDPTLGEIRTLAASAKVNMKGEGGNRISVADEPKDPKQRVGHWA